MQLKKSKAWNWHWSKLDPVWQAQARSLVLGYPVWTTDQNKVFDISPYKQHGDMTIIGGNGGVQIDDFGPAMFTVGQNDYLNTGRHSFGNGKVSLFADSSQQWTAICRWRADNDIGTIFAIASATGSNKQIQVYNSSANGGGLAVILRGTTQAGLTSPDTLDDNVWRDVIVTWDGSNAHLYLYPYDLDQSLSVGSASEETSQNLTFFARTNGAGFHLNGGIDQFFLFSRAWNRCECERYLNDPYGFLQERRKIATWLVPATGVTATTGHLINGGLMNRGLVNRGLIS